RLVALRHFIVVIPDAISIHNTCMEYFSPRIDGGDEMGGHRDREMVDRRSWLRTAAGSVAGLGAFSGPAGAGRADEDVKVEEAEEVRRAEAQARRATTRPLRTLRTAHYQAIGDASEAFIKLTLADCEKMASDYIQHFRSRGFDVNLPGRRLTVIVFRDERPF